MEFCPRCQRSVVPKEASHRSPDGKLKHLTGTCPQCHVTLYRRDSPVDEDDGGPELPAGPA